VTNFGDSITCGYYASPQDGSGNVHSLEGYAGVLDQEIGAPSANLCRGADMAADMTRLWVYPNATPALGQAQLYTVLIGVNDAGFCGSGAGCISNWSQTLAASLAWLALPVEDKVFATSMTASGGGWTRDLGIGEATTTQGASLSFDVQQTVAGRSLYVAYRVFAPWAVSVGTASLSVDGRAAGTMSSTPDTGLGIDTYNGTTDTIFLLSVPLGDVGQHAVRIGMTSPDGTFFSVLWAGASSANYAEVAAAPRVLVGLIANTTDASRNAAITLYNQALTPLVGGLVADGMNITIAPTAGVLIAPTDFYDEVHPNTGGHAKLAAAFAGVL
jgi:lysophospholipase L1-like esterase